jgi:hypothetical protein
LLSHSASIDLTGPVSDLVNEICEWANVELVRVCLWYSTQVIHYGQQRKKWSNAPGLYKDIEDWHAKLDHARSKFSV